MKRYFKIAWECLFLYWFATDFYKYFKADKQFLSLIALIAMVFECIYLYDYYSKLIKAKSNSG